MPDSFLLVLLLLKIMTNQVKIGDEMDKTLKIRLHRIIVSTILLVIALILPPKDMVSIGLYLCAYFIVGHDVLYKAIKHLFTGQLLDENFLMSLATIGALFLGEYLESVMVMLLYQVGELFQSYAVGKSRTSISSLMDIRPDYANLSRDGQLEKVDPNEVHTGELIVIKSDRNQFLADVRHDRRRAAENLRLLRRDLRQQIDDPVHESGGEVPQQLLSLAMIETRQPDHDLVRVFFQLGRKRVEEERRTRIAALVHHDADHAGGVSLHRLRIERGTVVQFPDLFKDPLFHRQADLSLAAERVGYRARRYPRGSRHIHDCRRLFAHPDILS